MSKAIVRWDGVVIESGLPASGRGKRGPDKAPRKPVEKAPPPPHDFHFVSEAVRKMEERRANVVRDIPHILKHYFGFEYMPFHIELLEMMFAGGTYVVNWPTDHAKSWMTSYFFPILSLMENPDEAHIICGPTREDSERRVQMIARVLEGQAGPTSKELIRDYPHIQRPPLELKTNWSAAELTVVGRTTNRPDPSVVARSAGSTDVYARRGKLILDDCEGPQHRLSRSKRDKLYEFIKYAALRCYEDETESKRPLVVACGTPFDVDSIYFRLERQGDETDWIAHRRMVYTDPQPWKSTDPWDHCPPISFRYLDPEGWIKDKNQHLLWPAKLDKVRKQYRRMTKAEFAVAYLMDPKEGNPSRLSLEEIEQLAAEASELDDKALTFISIDPASGTGNRDADYCGISVVRVQWGKTDPLPQVELVHAMRLDYPQGVTEHVQVLSELAKVHPAARITIEGNSQQRGTYQNLINHQAPWLSPRVVWVYTTGGESGNKFDLEGYGLTLIRTLIQEKRLLCRSSKLEDDGIKTFMLEVRDLGARDSHDHISASVWFPIRWVYDQIRNSGAFAQNAWGAFDHGQQPRDFIDREPGPGFGYQPSQNGWGQVGISSYRRW